MTSTPGAEHEFPLIELHKIIKIFDLSPIPTTPAFDELEVAANIRLLSNSQAS
jgi:hypothetical protein